MVGCGVEKMEGTSSSCSHATLQNADGFAEGMLVGELASKLKEAHRVLDFAIANSSARSQTGTEQVPNRLRICLEWTSNKSQTSPEQSPNKPHGPWALNGSKMGPDQDQSGSEWACSGPHLGLVRAPPRAICILDVL